MSRSDREGWNQLTWLFKFALIRICLRAALSVICFANASSPKGRAEKPERIFCLTHNPNLSLTLGEMSRSDREGWNQLTWLFEFALIRICLRAALSVICLANASFPKGRAEKPVRICLLLCTIQLVSPSGRDVAQRQRGLAPAAQKKNLSRFLRKVLFACRD